MAFDYEQQLRWAAGKLDSGKELSLIDEQQVKVRWDLNIPPAALKGCAEWLKTNRRTATEAVVEYRTLSGVWRLVAAEWAGNRSGGKVVATMAKGLATTISWTEARLMSYDDVTTNSSTVASLTNSTSHNPQLKAIVRFPNVDPEAVATMIGTLSDTYADKEVDGNPLSGTWRVGPRTSGREEDGSAFINVTLYRPQYTLNSYEYYDTAEESEVIYLWNVPKDIAQQILDDFKALRDGSSARVNAGMEPASAVVHMTLYRPKAPTSISSLSDLADAGREVTSSHEILDMFGINEGEGHVLSVVFWNLGQDSRGTCMNFADWDLALRYLYADPWLNSEVAAWVSDTDGGSYSARDVVTHSGLPYINLTGTNTDTDPSSDGTNWAAYPIAHAENAPAGWTGWSPGTDVVYSGTRAYMVDNNALTADATNDLEAGKLRPWWNYAERKWVERKDRKNAADFIIVFRWSDWNHSFSDATETSEQNTSGNGVVTVDRATRIPYGQHVQAYTDAATSSDSNGTDPDKIVVGRNLEERGDGSFSVSRVEKNVYTQTDGSDAIIIRIDGEFKSIVRYWPRRSTSAKNTLLTEGSGKAVTSATINPGDGNNTYQSVATSVTDNHDGTWDIVQVMGESTSTIFNDVTGDNDYPFKRRTVISGSGYERTETREYWAMYRASPSAAADALLDQIQDEDNGIISVVSGPHVGKCASNMWCAEAIVVTDAGTWTIES